jgi:hypothetical protein
MRDRRRKIRDTTQPAPKTDIEDRSLRRKLGRRLADLHALRLWGAAQGAEIAALRTALRQLRHDHAALEGELLTLRATRLGRFQRWLDRALARTKLNFAERSAWAREAALIRESSLFDEAWYLARNPGAAAFKGGPLLHFVICGWREGRDPSPAFNTVFYLTENPDVVRARANPLAHYVSVGRAEGRAPAPSAEAPRAHAPRPSPMTLKRIIALGERCALGESPARKFPAPVALAPDRLDVVALFCSDPEAIGAWFEAPATDSRLIVVDDGANPGVRGLLDREIMAGRDLVLLRRLAAQGPIAAANGGVAAATSRLVAIAPVLAGVRAHLALARDLAASGQADFVLVAPGVTDGAGPDIEAISDVKSKVLLSRLEQGLLLVDRNAFAALGGFNEAADVEYAPAVADLLARAAAADRVVMVLT